MKRKYFNVIFAVLVLASAFLLSEKSSEVMKGIIQADVTAEKKLIVIDAGHGGFVIGQESRGHRKVVGVV